MSVLSRFLARLVGVSWRSLGGVSLRSARHCCVAVGHAPLMLPDGPEGRIFPEPPARQPSNDARLSRDQGASRERGIAEIAARQHGLVTFEQLRTVGLSTHACLERLRAGRLFWIHKRVYAVGHPKMTTERRWMAAVLACGPSAVLSHRSAAALWGLLPPRSRLIDVTAPGRRGRLIRGVAAHRDGSLCDLDRTRVRAIPCTTAARTLLDLAGVVPEPLLRRAIGEAEVLHVLNRRALRELLKRNRGRRGVARLRSCLLQSDPQTGRTRNELERSFLSLCGQAGLSPPQVNCLLEVDGGLVEVDFLWREARLIVETDGREVHGTATASARDLRRDQQLMLVGWRVARFDWWQVTREPTEVSRVVRGLLAQSAGRTVGP